MARGLNLVDDAFRLAHMLRLGACLGLWACQERKLHYEGTSLSCSARVVGWKLAAQLWHGA